MKNFQDRLRTARELMRTPQGGAITQKALADMLGVHRFTVSKWEQGRTLPGKTSDYTDLAQIMNVDEVWLREGKGEMGVYHPSPETDRAQRKILANRIGSLPMPTTGNAGAIDWSLVVALVRVLESVEANMPHGRFARALGTLYAVAMSGTGIPEEELVKSILWGIQ